MFCPAHHAVIVEPGVRQSPARARAAGTGRAAGAHTCFGNFSSLLMPFSCKFQCGLDICRNVEQFVFCSCLCWNFSLISLIAAGHKRSSLEGSPHYEVYALPNRVFSTPKFNGRHRRNQGRHQVPPREHFRVWGQADGPPATGPIPLSRCTSRTLQSEAQKEQARACSLQSAECAALPSGAGCCAAGEPRPRQETQDEPPSAGSAGVACEAVSVGVILIYMF